MLTWGATILLVAWAWVPSSAAPQRFPPAAFNPRPPPTVTDLELQRLGILTAMSAKIPVETSGDYSDAIYAAHLAKELTTLEANKKNIYVDFISSIYMNPEVRRGFPPDLQRLSRGAPSLHTPARAVHSSSSSSSVSFGSRPGFAPSFGHRLAGR